MDLMETVRIYGALLSTVAALFGAVKWILSVKIAPLEAKNSELILHNEKQNAEIKELRKEVLDELKKISHANFEFRREYENGINEIKLLLAVQHVSKEDFQREMTDMHKRVDTEYDIKIIKEAVKQLNS